MSFIFDGGVWEDVKKDKPTSQSESGAKTNAYAQDIDSKESSASASSETNHGSPASGVTKKQSIAPPMAQSVANDLALAREKARQLREQAPPEVTVDGKWFFREHHRDEAKWLSREGAVHDTRVPTQEEVKKASFHEVGKYWGVKDLETQWFQEDYDPPPPPETMAAKFGRHKDLQHVLKALITAVHREVLPNPVSKLFQGARSKITTTGRLPKDYYTDKAWELDKKYFTEELERKAQREYQQNLRDSTKTTTYATADSLRYAFDRFERPWGGKINKKLLPGARVKGRVRHSDKWHHPDFDPGQVNCRLRDKQRTTTGNHFTWAHSERKALDQKFKRCEHLLDLMRRERDKDLQRDLELLDPAVSNHARARIAKERADAADNVMSIMSSYHLISNAELAGYLLHTLLEYRTRQELEAEEAGAETTAKFDTEMAQKSVKAEREALTYALPYPRAPKRMHPHDATTLKLRRKARKEKLRRKRELAERTYRGAVMPEATTDRGVLRRPMPTAKSYAAEKILLDLDQRGLWNIPSPPKHRDTGHLVAGKPYSTIFEAHVDRWDGFHQGQRYGKHDPLDKFGLIRKNPKKGSGRTRPRRKSTLSQRTRRMLNLGKGLQPKSGKKGVAKRRGELHYRVNKTAKGHVEYSTRYAKLDKNRKGTK